MPPPPTAKMKSKSAIKPRQTMRGHTGQATGVAHLPDGRRIITCSIDSSLRLWDLEGGVQIGNDWRDVGDEAAVYGIALSPNGEIVVSGSRDGTIRLWDVEREKVVAKWTGHTHAVWSLCWSVDGERVVSGGGDGTIRVWDVESGDTVLGPINTGHKSVWAVIYSPDTTKIATGGYNESAFKIWDAKTGNLLSTIKHDHQVWSLAWTSDQKKVITGSYRSIRIFDTATWQQIAILEGHTFLVFSLSLFQNDRLLASGSVDNTVRLWNLDTNLPVGPPIQHESHVYSVAISAHGKLLVTGCGDRNAYLWDIHTTLKDAGLEDLLCIPDVPPDGLKQKVTPRKSLMETDATRHRVKHEYTYRLPPRFFDDAPDGVQPPNAHPHSSAHPGRPDDIFLGGHTGSSGNITSPASTSDVSGPVVLSGGKDVVPVHHVNKVTHCACSQDGSHLNEIALETVLPGTPDKIYNLMFASLFIKDFMRIDQKLMDVQISDWCPTGDNPKLLARNMSYVKPLNDSVGPKQTKYDIHDEAVVCDFDNSIVILTTTKTPDIPSGSIFSVKTRTCIMWESAISTRVIITTQVEWTGRSFIKDLIEKSAIDDQKVYHSDLDKSMRMYIQEHQAEFIPAGVDPTAVAPVEPISPIVELLQSHSSVPAEVILQDLTASITKVGNFPVARGGFGEVWKCIYQTDLGPTDVAVKSLLMYTSDQDYEGMKKKIKRIRRELKICARLHHPNILPVYGYTHGFGLLIAIVCPWAKNGNLTVYLEKENSTLTFIRRFEVLRDIASGLQYLHANKIIHGDLNGPNVLIHGDGTACLADFGLSLVYSEVISISAASWTSAFHGNFRWLAPELLGEPEDELPVRPSERSDIYSFGGIMLHVLTSKTPYYYLGEAVVTRCIYTGVKPSRSRYPAFSDNYWCFIEECWSAEPLDRPSADRLVEVITDEFNSLSSSSAGT